MELATITGTPAPAGVRSLVEQVAQTFGVSVVLWDGTRTGPPGAPTVRVRTADALRRLLWAPNEIGLGRAYVAGDLDLELGADGDLVETLSTMRRTAPKKLPLRRLASLMVAAARAGVVGRPLPPPPEEARLHGLRHSTRRDAQAISHHYDVGNDFYRLVLGPSMTYSCARFVEPGATLEEAQESKHDLVCRKLGLDERPGMRLLDVGCGWGSTAIHAATRYGARVVGVTISREQQQLARQRVAEAGVESLVDIRLQDYRELRGEQFDAIASIGMSEHVGRRQLDVYFGNLASLLAPRGRLLNHAISVAGGSRISPRTFMGRYVFPDAELVDVGDTILAMERAGLEVRDVESLREHYAETLRHWVANLERHLDEAIRLVGERRARTWRVYMAASVHAFEVGRMAVHQVVGVRPDPEGASGMPRTRDGWTTPHRSERLHATVGQASALAGTS